MLAREVEANSPHLIDPADTSGLPAGNGLTIADPPRDSFPLEHGCDIGVENQPIPQLEDTGIEVLGTARAEDEGAEQGRQSELEPQVRKRAKEASRNEVSDAARRRVKRPLSVAVGDRKSQIGTLKDLFAEDIDVLEEENKQLRRMLAAELHAQNERLSTMLARFDII